MRINAIDIHYRLRVLSGISACYGAASSQILAIYENFQVFAVSVLLLAISLFLLKTPLQKKGNGEAQEMVIWRLSFPFSVLCQE
ncbi:hypothetical protein [Leclercia sp.]|uniref:hypothetical protein n=1 Tax=Leclercia sp. TaxID=1898428 RepID=UPI0028B09E37|nr:hypothetical protein [Leclercia sp.]